MFGLGKCKHPFDMLAVYKHSTSEPSPKFPEDYTNHSIHLFCRKCGAGDLERYGTDGGLTIKYAKTIGGHEAAMARAMARLKAEDEKGPYERAAERLEQQEQEKG